MNRSIWYITSVVIGLSFLVGACSDAQGPDTGSTAMLGAAGPKDPLDRELDLLLLAASDGEGRSFFQLPFPDQFERIPQDPLNPLTREKVRLGKHLYHETALGGNNVRPEGRETYACASCHFAQAGFMANTPQGIAEGGWGFGVAGEARTFQPAYDSDPDSPDCQPIRTPTVLNSAYQELMLWNGQFGGIGDNLGTEDKWTSGTPLESNFLGMHGVETQAHGGLLAHRMIDVGLTRINTIPRYQNMFQLVFPADPAPINRLNVALAIAAFERTVLANDSPFQHWLRGNSNAMTRAGKRGAILFFGKAGCVACHTGPALNSMTFYALGMNDLDGAWDVTRVNLAPFGGTVPDAARKGRGGFTGLAEDEYKFKTPQLYNLLDSPHYGHGASFATVREVIEYKNAAVAENAIVPAGQLASEFQPLALSSHEIDDLVVFIEDALYDPRLLRYVPQRLPSGNCFPANDEQARLDLGCERGKIAARWLGEK